MADAGLGIHQPAVPGRPGGRLPRLLPGRTPAVALVALLLAATALVGGPFAAPTATSLAPASPDAGAAPARSPVAGARPWPSWAGALAEAPLAGTFGGPPVSRTPGSVAYAASTPPLSTGYRGWGSQPPAAIVARGPRTPGETDPLAAEVRGIYLTAYTAGQPAAFRDLIELVDSTALNAMVINIKDETGRATYDTRVEAFHRTGALGDSIADLEALLRLCQAYGIYTIGRLVVFNDSTLPRHDPDLAVKRPDGSLWRDHVGNYWSDPFRPEVWEYNMDLAEEAARLGFDEVQFDYVRFPTDGDTRNAVFSRPSGPDNANRVQAIDDFLTYARGRLVPYGTLVSADVFGIILSTRVDTSLGQVLEDITPCVDYLSPMVYPSHYGPGHFRLSMPDAEPYLTVRGALIDGLNRLGPEAKAKFRPWLQDFSLYNHYGPEQVLDQIRATHELGVKGWMLWSPSNVYTKAALRAYTANQEAYLGEGG